MKAELASLVRRLQWRCGVQYRDSTHGVAARHTTESHD